MGTNTFKRRSFLKEQYLKRQFEGIKFEENIQFRKNVLPSIIFVKIFALSMKGGSSLKKKPY
jgi:hypothetical protein